MALKLTSWAWRSASGENRSQRDALRRQFFADAGITPAKSLREVYRTRGSRPASIAAQMATVKDNRLGDADLAAAAAAAESAMAAVGLGIPSLPVGRAERQPLGRMGLAPEVLKKFFLTDQETALERSIF